ncbi:MAG: glycosyltransferase family protein [Pseudomonadota bacterium]
MAERPRTAVIVQARRGSTRLPDKVLMDLAGRTALARCLVRCRRIDAADVVVCAVPKGVENDPVAAEAARAGAVVFRGSETDVLARYAAAARSVGAARVMRITSDCPFIDPAICDRVIAYAEQTGADYTCNNMPPSWPHGLDCDLFSSDLLYSAEKNATSDYEREHVTPWIRTRDSVRKASLVGPGGLAADQRWTLDYKEDLLFARSVFDTLGPAADTAHAADIMALVLRRPDIADMNAGRVDAARIGAGEQADIVSAPQRLEAA